jgi:CDP-diacylglycerol--serine O-phosphatidyltransferase
MVKNPSHFRRNRFRRDQINRLLPNALTILGLCAGLTAIRFGFEGQWNVAIFLIAGAAVLDTLDGRIARLVGSPSDFGGQLDSLVDSIAFGVAPIITIYLWGLKDVGGAGWAIALMFPVCCVLRLARFNVSIGEESRPAWSHGYFTGIPAPAGAGLLLLPLILSLETDWDWLRSPWFIGPWTLIIALLMISRLPTWSFKRLKIPAKYFSASMAALAFFAAAIFTEPLLTLGTLVIVYAISIPISVHSYTQHEKDDRLRTANSDQSPPTD